jgi:hypothetical protein
LTSTSPIFCNYSALASSTSSFTLALARQFSPYLPVPSSFRYISGPTGFCVKSQRKENKAMFTGAYSYFSSSLRRQGSRRAPAQTTSPTISEPKHPFIALLDARLRGHDGGMALFICVCVAVFGGILIRYSSAPKNRSHKNR